MLVTFSCKAYADITLFGDIAVRLLKMMGHSGTVPSTLLAEDVESGLNRLQAALEADQSMPPVQEGEEDEAEPMVSLAQRAYPLLELLKAAQKAQCNVMWDKG